MGRVPEVPPGLLIHLASDIPCWRIGWNGRSPLSTLTGDRYLKRSIFLWLSGIIRCSMDFLPRDLREAVRDAAHTPFGADVNSRRGFPFIEDGLDVTPVNEDGGMVGTVG